MSTLIVAGAQHAGSALVQTASTAALSYANSAISNAFDNRVFEGPQLEGFHVQTSRDGAPMSRVYGRIRLAGQLIWASRLKENVTETPVQSGKGGGPTQRNYSYTISFAIGLCEGEILGIDRLWANGSPLNIPGLVSRIYKGTDRQLPDPIISAIEGVAPAFRGTAYIVFEDFPLDDFGTRLPQINAEIIRVPPALNDAPRLETMIRGVNLLPGSGEFAYATEIAEETPTPISARPINMNNLSGKPDIELALDQLETQLPNVKNVSIITSWFGTDLRCGECEIHPGVETKTRITPDVSWRVGGMTRGAAYLVSQDEAGRPNYGGTPSDSSILQAISALKSRGYKVTLYPFILMDVPTGNKLPDPYGAFEQAAFPWRGRISCHPQSDEKTEAVIPQIDHFFGTATAADFQIENGHPNYKGDDEFSFRRFILHYAKLAQISGGVDRFVIGSEMRGLTTLRDSKSNYPAVKKLTELAEDVRIILGAQTQITYAADWSEYFGHHPQDGSGDINFHLDPLWASSAIDAIGIDAYFPLSDWRDGKGHLDSEVAQTPYDKVYLQSQMEGGEGYDYFYASPADRTAQNRSPIEDGSVGKPWVYRYKDLRNWWGQHHYNRRSGVEAQTPTLWAPQSKPIWLMEIGCPAINKGANQPNVFYDPKSSESVIPYFSNSARDDLIQRRYLEAFIDYWALHNEVSSVYGAQMIDLDMINVWAWDARPFPDFPARSNVWSDGGNWERGHWLSGRMGLVPLSDIVTDICGQSGLGAVDVTQVTGLVQGYHINRPMTGRAALTPLSALYGFNLIETAQGLRFASDETAATFQLSVDDIIGDLSSAVSLEKTDPEERLKDARIHFIDASNDYQLGFASARDLAAETVRVADINVPIVMDQSFALFAAEQILNRNLQSNETLSFAVTGQRLDLEVGDDVIFPNAELRWKIQSLEGITTQRVSARLTQSLLGPPLSAPPLSGPPLSGPVPAVTSAPSWAMKPVLLALDLPSYEGVLVGAALTPFSETRITSPNSDVRATSSIYAGALLTEMKRGAVGRWDYSQEVDIFLPGVTLSSISSDAVLAGDNKFAVETPSGWEIFQASFAQLIGENTYRLSKFLRGLRGTEVDIANLVTAGARIIWLGSGWEVLPLSEGYIGETISLNASAAGRTSDILQFDYKAKYLRPLAPVHVKMESSEGQTRLSWIRQSRIESESWAGMDVPLGEDIELYRVQLLAGEQLIFDSEVRETHITLSQTDVDMADIISIAQGSRAFGWGASFITGL